MTNEFSVNWVVVFSAVIFLAVIVLLVRKFLRERYLLPEEQTEAVVQSISYATTGSPAPNRQIGQSGIMTNMGVVRLAKVVFQSPNGTIALMASEKDARNLNVNMKGKLRYRGDRMIRFEA